MLPPVLLYWPRWSVADCCSLLYLQHNKTAVKVKEDMMKMVQIPMLRPRTVAAKHTRVFGASLLELQEKGLVKDGVPLLVRRMVEHLSKHGETKFIKRELSRFFLCFSHCYSV